MANYYHLMLENWTKQKELAHQAREQAVRDEALTTHKCDYPELKPKRRRWHFLSE
jgi:hypothetical protein